MRVVLGRGNWRPNVRIEGLRRYAFVGDSTAYGQGVAPDETLAACAERQMNQMLPSWPVEGVNLGVCGYNLWNSWFDFKHNPQVYDGVVFALCNNDVELFGRTYQVVHPPPSPARWEKVHPLGAAVAHCFDDIASFSREQSLPVAVIYYNAYDNRDQVQIGEIIEDLCASRGFCFLDTLAHYRDRNFTPSDLVVSSANRHPSTTAHEAVGRHLAATLQRQGWFREYEEPAISLAPDRILTAARAMVELDRYPADAALDWALRALDAKSRLARRLKATGRDGDFSFAAARAADVLTSASRRWHIIQRTKAFSEEIIPGGYGVAGGLVSMHDERLRLEELAFALGTGDWNRLADGLPQAEPAPQSPRDGLPSTALAFLNACSLELSCFRDSLEGLRSLAASSAIGSGQDDASMLCDLAGLSQIGDRTHTECAALKATFLRLESTLNEVRSTLSETEIARVSTLVGASFRRMKAGFGFVSRMATAIARIQDADPASFTTVEITIRGETIEGKPICIVGGQAEYSVPRRFSFNYADNFLLDGSTSLVKLYFPVLYAGRISFGTHRRRPVLPESDSTNPFQAVETTLIKVELKNGAHSRRSFDPASFSKDRNGRYHSPFMYLP
jgi:hypothetical protein